MKRTRLTFSAGTLLFLPLIKGPPLYAQSPPQKLSSQTAAGSTATSGQIPPTVPFGYGIVLHTDLLSPAEYKMFHSTGFGLIRADFSWRDIEKTPGVYDFKKYDAQYTQLKTLGVRPLWILDYTNPNYDKDLPPYTEEGLKAYARFAGAAAAHFRNRDVLWEIWNEPNEPHFWAGNPNAEQYASLVKATVPTIRAADPKACILVGAISQMDLPYITRFLHAHPLEGVTAFSLHPYRDGQPETVISDYAAVRHLIDLYNPTGQKPVPIVCSEWGYTTADGQTSEADQSRYVVRMYLVNMLSGVDMTILYEWKNDGPESGNNEHRYGILRQDLAPKPAYTAISEFLRTMRGYTFRHRICGQTPADFKLLFQSSQGLALVTWTSAEAAPLAAQTPRITKIGKSDPTYPRLLQIAQAKTSADDLPYTDVLPRVPGVVMVLSSSTRENIPPLPKTVIPEHKHGELLVNPGFEVGRSGWVASIVEPAKRVGITNAVSHTGGKSAFMTAEPGTSPSWFSWSQTVLKVTPGEQYTFTGWVKKADTRGPSGWFIHVNGPHGLLYNTILSTVAGYSDWLRVTQTFTVPPGGVSITIGTSLYGSGVAYFDDASLTNAGDMGS